MDMKLPAILLLLTFTINGISLRHRPRIFDGSEAAAGAYPWMVSIRLDIIINVVHLCGGVIIADDYVLTAASCVEQGIIFSSFYSIKAGSHSILDGSEDTEQTRKIAQIIVHPNYTSTSSLNNIALIRVTQPFDTNMSRVSTIPLSNLVAIDGFELVTIGWGYSENVTNTTRPTLFLQETMTAEDVQCTAEIATDPQTQLCASGACQGDTGGPLMFYSDDHQQYELAGITGPRNACTSRGLFTRVAPFTEWITSTMANPPPIVTFPPFFTVPTPVLPTPKPDMLGPPIPFQCDRNYPCGCSPVPVIFRDEPPFENSTRRGAQGRIVGGENAEPHSWPWTVSIRSGGNTHSCGGTLLSKDWVLTAAHCLTIGLTIHIGVHNVTHPSPQVRTSAQFILHPEYEPPPRYVNDIALIRLSAPVDLALPENYAGVTCTPPRAAGRDYPAMGTRLAVVGWGRLLYSGTRPQVLRQVRVMTIANNDTRCLNSIFNPEKQFCAMVDGGEKDSCQGDSGGPIHQWLDDHWEQVGIVSYGTGCAQAEHPGIYTRLSMYFDWIESIMQDTNATTSIPGATTLPANGSTTGIPGATTVPANGSTTGIPGATTVPANDLTTDVSSAMTEIPSDTTIASVTNVTITTSNTTIEIPAGTTTTSVPNLSTSTTNPIEIGSTSTTTTTSTASTTTESFIISSTMSTRNRTTESTSATTSPGVQGAGTQIETNLVLAFIFQLLLSVLFY